MEQNSHSIQEQKYPEAEFFFQDANSELDLEADYFSWKIVKRRQKPQRRYTVSHAAPPAPPSTPTSLSKEHDPLNELSLSMSPTDYHYHQHSHHNGDLTTNGNVAATEVAAAENTDDCRLGSLLYILDYAPKYKKKLKEQQRTDAELAELFKVVTITGSGIGGGGGGGGGSGCSGRGKADTASGSNHQTSSAAAPEHGVSFLSRRIRRPGLNSSLFRIYRNPDDTVRDLHDEDSLSAPEFEASTEENMSTRRRCRLYSYSKRKLRRLLRQRQSVKKSEMNEIVDTFDSTMSFQPAE